jgi:hypothetical protein
MNLDLFTNVKRNPRGRSILRRSLVGLLLLISFISLTAFWPNIPDVDKGTPLVATSPPPTHVVWQQREVGGYLLCTPPDSTGHSRCIRLPDGCILAIPYVHPGEDPDTLRTKT